VDAVGSAVTNVKEGDKVIVHPLITCGLCRACRAGDDVHCAANSFPGLDTNGGYADYLNTSARSVVKLDDALEPSDAAAKVARRLTPRDKCVIIGAGGLGHIGIQVLKALSPAELIVVDRSPEALKLEQSFADHGVLADGRVRQVLDLTDGDGAEVVVDRLPRRRLGREHRRPDHRHHLHRDQLHRQSGRVVQRPVRSHRTVSPRDRICANVPYQSKILPKVER